MAERSLIDSDTTRLLPPVASIRASPSAFSRRSNGAAPWIVFVLSFGSGTGRYRSLRTAELISPKRPSPVPALDDFAKAAGGESRLAGGFEMDGRRGVGY